MRPTSRTNLTPANFEIRERILCLKCLRARSVCFCEDILPFQPTFDTILLQHPKERKHSIGTARLTHLSLINSRIVVGTEFDADRKVNALLDDPKNYCVLLYPGPDAVNIQECQDELRTHQADRKLVVFVIDGTWPQARGMFNKSQRLAAIPQIKFNPDIPSQYKVRRQPHRFCVSTIEAVHHLIRLLDPESNPDSLLATFTRLVEQQVKYGIVGKKYV